MVIGQHLASCHKCGKQWICGDCIPELCEACDFLERIGTEFAELRTELARLRAENERLLRGDFTEEEFQNLCHKFDESDAERFAVGCRLYWEKLFGKDKAAVCAAADQPSERAASVVLSSRREAAAFLMRRINMKSLPNRIRAFLAAEPDPDPQYMSSFIGEARILLRQAMEEIEHWRRLAEPVWPEECDDPET